MDLKQNHNSSSVITDQAALRKSALGLSSTLCLTLPRRKPANGWLDAAANEDADSGYRNWASKCPSALASFEKIANAAKEKEVALFMDYDGTLSPIVGNPDHAFMSTAMRNAVKDAAKCFPSAIISGRSREKVYDFIGLQELYYVGSHGMDLAFPFKSGFDCPTDDQLGNNVSMYQPANEFLPMIDEVFNSLIEKTKDIHGSKIENNKFCVSVHYRLVDQNNWAVVAQRVHDILKNYPRFELTYGRKVIEIRPTIRRNKGTAVEFLLESLNLNDSRAVLPIYIGDDRSDEDAFKVLRERNSGYGILVSSIPKETNAHFSLKDPSEVLAFLKSLVIWKQSQVVLQRST